MDQEYIKWLESLKPEELKKVREAFEKQPEKQENASDTKTAKSMETQRYPDPEEDVPSQQSSNTYFGGESIYLLSGNANPRHILVAHSVPRAYIVYLRS
ncbi:hypothetical protein BC937DRAFT_93246 [Endogone sp. FLAS-F59071]|nr:hypothetical protein BC937DRAFT_93246 [Endogone sp. FLAS-F59071]|eukprot:RUS14841.1 hypothetical protein BC937DRAFT_93246 [Endogone sp. FLAS-F59071]